MSSFAFPSGKVSPEQLDQLLHLPIVARLGTITEDGYPYVIPVWFDYDGMCLWVAARAKARYIQHIARNPKVALSVARDDMIVPRALILGHAEIVAGPGLLATLGEHYLQMVLDMARRYAGDKGEQYIKESMDWPRCIIRLTPERVISWGDSDWHPRYKV